MTRPRGRGSRRFWTAADDAVIRRDYPQQSTGDVARQLGRSVSAVYARAMSLQIGKSAAYLASPAACRMRRGDNIGAAFRFQPGQTPANKGLRRPGWGPGRMKATQFRKGTRQGLAARLYKPIGTERISKDGYLQRKVNDDLPLQARWRMVHLLLWEAEHGPIPKGYALSFLNGDRTDIRLDNLECIPRAELMKRNSVHNLPPPLVETIQLLGAVTRLIRRRARGQEQNQ